LISSSANGLSNENSDLDLCITSDEIDQLLKEQDGKRTRSKDNDPLADIIHDIAKKLRKGKEYMKCVVIIVINNYQ
jgi:hypothetical protein